MNNDRLLTVIARTSWIGAAIVSCVSLMVEHLVDVGSAQPELTAVNGKLRYGLLIFASVIAGGYRAALHPFFDRNYARWLDTMPWMTGTALPLRRIVFGWKDIAFISVAMGLQWSMNAELMWDIPIAMLLAYLVVCVLPCAAHRKPIGMYAVGLGFVATLLLMPWSPLVCAALVLAFLLVISDVRRTAVEHVWTAPFGDDRQLSLRARIVDYRRDFTSIKQGVGFPYSTLNKLPQRFAPRGWHKLGMSVVVGLFVYAVILRVAFDPNSLNIIPAVSMIGFLVLGRLLPYSVRGESPMSLWGRLRTGHLIIPGHDVIYVAPLLAAVSGMASAYFATHLAESAAVGAAVGIGVLLFVSLSVGPSLHDWTLTGACRLREANGQDTMVERI